MPEGGFEKRLQASRVLGAAEIEEQAGVAVFFSFEEQVAQSRGEGAVSSLAALKLDHVELGSSRIEGVPARGTSLRGVINEPHAGIELGPLGQSGTQLAK
jgi:hypothetical protein